MKTGRAPSPVGVALAIAVSSLGCARSAADHRGQIWSYTGPDGPARWGELAPELALCKTGKAQSPIDIPASVDRARLVPIVFNEAAIPLRIESVGYTFQVLGSRDASIALGPTDAERYALAQLHFHSPSEHTMAGRAFAAELHLVHKNAAGSVAVVAVFFEEGKELPALTPILDNAPSERAAPKDVAGVTVDLKSLVPDGSGYTEYVGSLTVPPCTEGVRWLVLSTPLTASAAQIQKLRDLLGGPTNRPVQPIGDRRVLQFTP